MNKQTIGYWAATGLVALAFAAGGVMYLSAGAETAEALAHLGYPAYLVAILGVWKVLGAAAIVAPRFPRLKEWAYAGMFFDLSGAAVSHAVVGDPAVNVIVPLVLAGLVFASWALRPQSRTLAAAAGAAPARATEAMPADAALAR
jgi:hypothetical protein